MATDVIMPQMGESIFEGTITKWLKKPGDRIERDEPLFEISTDKVDAEIPAPAAGVLKEIKVEEGKTVPIQTVVAVIDAGDGAAAAAPAKEAPAKPETKPAPEAKAAPAKEEKKAEAPAKEPSAKVAPPEAARAGAPTPEAEDVRSSPLVRRLAKEHSIDLSQVEGTGAGGRVSKKDILAAIESGGAAAPAAGARPGAPPPAAGGTAARVALETAVPRERIYFGSYEVQPMSVMRQRIAEHMVMSKRVSPHVYSMDEVDMTRVAQLRAKHKGEFEKKFETKLSFMPFFIRACVEGLRAFPTVNSSVDGTNVVLHREINVGMAVALDWGLIVPVIKNAE
ncbi:MAG: dihydrolipoamide acetyltransferase family protein, partial [Candidatus Acidiferrales bacterium]